MPESPVTQSPVEVDSSSDSSAHFMGMALSAARWEARSQGAMASEERRVPRGSLGPTSWTRLCFDKGKRCSVGSCCYRDFDPEPARASALGFQADRDPPPKKPPTHEPARFVSFFAPLDFKAPYPGNDTHRQNTTKKQYSGASFGASRRSKCYRNHTFKYYILDDVATLGNDGKCRLE